MAFEDGPQGQALRVSRKELRDGSGPSYHAKYLVGRPRWQGVGVGAQDMGYLLGKSGAGLSSLKGRGAEQRSGVHIA